MRLIECLRGLGWGCLGIDAIGKRPGIEADIPVSLGSFCVEQRGSGELGLPFAVQRAHEVLHALKLEAVVWSHAAQALVQQLWGNVRAQALVDLLCAARKNYLAPAYPHRCTISPGEALVSFYKSMLKSVCTLLPWTAFTASMYSGATLILLRPTRMSCISSSGDKLACTVQGGVAARAQFSSYLALQTRYEGMSRKLKAAWLTL